MSHQTQYPEGDALQSQISTRHRRGSTWQILFQISTIIGIIALVALLYNITNQAFWMGYSEMFAGYGWFENYLDKLSAVTAKDIQRVANQYFNTQSRIVGTYVPMDGRQA